MTFDETMNSIHAQRTNFMRSDLAPTHVVFGFAEWDEFWKNARSQDLVFNDLQGGRGATVMGLRVVYSDDPQEAKVLADGAREYGHSAPQSGVENDRQ